jgi:hypothetical protein
LAHPAPHGSGNSHSGYEVDVRVHLIPGIGTPWLGQPEAEHLEKLCTKILRTGGKPDTAHHVHGTIRNALNEAKRRGRPRLAGNRGGVGCRRAVSLREVRRRRHGGGVKAFGCPPGRLNVAREAFAEYPPDPVDLTGPRPADQSAPVRSQFDDGPAEVTAVSAPDDQTVPLKPGDELGHRGLGDALPAGKVPEPLRTPVSEGGQHREPRR